MQDQSEDGDKPEQEGGLGTASEGTRPQRGGEAATTRFGMEDGDNIDTPAAGDDTTD